MKIKIAEATTVAITQIIKLFSLIFIVKILTTVLDEHTFGLYILSMTVITLYNQVYFGGYAVSFGRHSINKKITNISQKLIKISIIYLVFNIFVAIPLSQAFKIIDFDLSIILCIASLFAGFLNIFQNIANSMRARFVVLNAVILEYILKIPPVLIIYNYYTKSQLELKIILIIWMVSSMVVAFFYYIYLLKIKIEEYEVSESELNSFARPYQKWGLFTWGLQNSDRWSLGLLANIASVGIYGALYQVFYSPILLVSGMLTTYISPYVYKRKDAGLLRTKDYGPLRIIMILNSMFGFILCLVLFLYGEIIIGLILPKGYQDYSYLAALLVAAATVSAICNYISVKLAAEKKVESQMKQKILSSLFGIPLVFTGAYLFDLYGVVLSLMSISIINVIWMSYLVGGGSEKI